MLQHLMENCGEKIFTNYIYTNGAVLPPEELLAALNDGGYWVFIANYRDTALLVRGSIPQLEDTFQNWGIRYQTIRA